MNDLALCLPPPPCKQVRVVDQHVVATAERAKEGARELVVAQRTQRGTRNKCLWFALVMALIVSVILVIMFA
jgi:t-SNARE complex subunit (syntaxin)